MTRKEYIDRLMTICQFVRVLSNKNGCEVLQLQNKTLQQNFVLRSYPERIEINEVLCAIRCNNLPEIYDAIDLEDGQIVLEEFIDGITVAQVLETGKYHIRGAKKVLRGVCDALEVLHSRGIVHRDVKPENVMIARDGRVVLIDFNTSRKYSDVSKDTVIMGTVGYASPEQLGLAQSDFRTDIYAAGVLFNIMLTGQHPSVCLARGRAGRIVKKCTSIHPADRYQTARKLADDMK